MEGGGEEFVKERRKKTRKEERDKENSNGV